MDHLLSREKHTIKCDQLGSMNVLFSFEGPWVSQKKVFEKWIIEVRKVKKQRAQGECLGTRSR